MAAIELKHLNHSYGDTPVLSDIDLSIPEGSFTVLLGPSGSGKTTLLHCVAGLLRQTEGQVLFDGAVMDDVPIHKRGAVLVDQDVTLFPHMTVEQNIGFGLLMRKERKSVIREKVADLVRLMELEGHEKKLPSELSGGQMQRVALARALAVEPNVLLLDEPFSKLDISLRASMRTFVKDLVSREGLTTIMVTHDAGEALQMADTVAVLLDRRLEQVGTPQEVYECPVSRSVSEFFGERNYLTVTEGATAKTFVLRPDEIFLSRPTGREGERTGTVKNCAYTGEVYRYEVACDGVLLLAATMSHEAFRPGETVAVEYHLEGAPVIGENRRKGDNSAKKVKPKKVPKKT
ncbi:MAG: ABC transporter ATP-binding protein [Clostridia bacterium]|nr:ABC transporter ATP-binding protein [Clostridia bacterium]